MCDTHPALSPILRITTDSRLVVGVGCLQAVAAVASQEYLVERKLDQRQSEMLNLVFVLLPYKYVPISIITSPTRGQQRFTHDDERILLRRLTILCLSARLWWGIAGAGKLGPTF